MRSAALGARVQDVVLVDPLTIGLELYAGSRLYLTLSAARERQGLALGSQRPRRGPGGPTPLALALAARIEGGRLVGVHQPPWERILRFSFRGRDETDLVAELTGRMANVVLVDDTGVIRGVAKPVTSAMSRARVLLPGRSYVAPPTQTKASPDDATSAAVAEWLGASRDSAWRVLVQHVRAVSPLVAREAVHRAGGDPQATAAEVEASALASALADLLAMARTGSWSPSVARSGGRVTAYAPYRLTHLPAWEATPSVAAAVAAYEADLLGADPYRAPRQAVAALLAAAAARVEGRIRALGREADVAPDPDVLRRMGDLILAHQYSLRPGQTTLVAAYGPGDDPLEIALDPTLSPVANAEAYFDRYRRAKRGRAGLPARLARSEAARAYLQQLAADLALAEDRPAIDAVADMLASSGLGGRPSPRRGAGPPRGPLRLVTRDGFVVWVGRNSRQNETVTFRRGAKGDLWLHALGVPGSHVVIKAAGRQVPRGIRLSAAAVAAWFSKARNSTRVDVAITDVARVKRGAGGFPGLVTYTRAATLSVTPAPPDQAFAGAVAEPSR